MQRSRTFLKGHFVVVSLVLLAGLFMSCGMVQAQLQAEQVSNQIRPEIKAQLQDLKKEIVEKGYSFTVGYNPAMEYTIPELCGLVVPKGWRQFAMFENTESYLSSTSPSYDWRNYGGGTPVKNQGSCGSCWAFGTVAPLEELISIHCGKVEDLSEQYLVSCNENNWSCSGGWFAHDYHQSYIPTTKKETAAGAVLDANFPYTGTNAACNGPHAHSYKINSWSYVAGISVPSVAAIKNAIQTYGPVSTSVCVGSAFQAYRSGIFNADVSCSGTVNHAVTLVGWDDNGTTDNGYWILKNSWGTGWGEKGYMRIRWGVSKVGYATNYINFSNCGTTPVPGLNCSTATALTLGTLYSGQSTAVGGQSNVSTYGCSGRTESGPEKVYTVTTTKTGDLTATLSGMATGLDLDVFILSACNPTSCLAFGDASAKYANAPAGTYYIVVDGNNGASGQYSLQTALATALPDLTGAWTAVTSYNSGRTVYGTLKVSNIGGAAAGKFNVAYYLSTTSTSAGTYVSSQTVTNGLAVGGVQYLYPVFSATTSLRGKYLRAVIDYDAKIAESNENNNVAVSGGITKARPR